MLGTIEVAAWCLSGRYDNTQSEYRPGTIEAFMQEATSFVSCSDPRARPAGRRHDNKSPPAGSCKFVEGEPAGQIRGFFPRLSQKQPAGHDGLARE